MNVLFLSKVFKGPKNKSAIRVGAGTNIKYLVHEVHYGLLENIPPEGDNSGFIVHWTRTPRPKSAGTIHMGAGGYAAPHSTTHFEVVCKIQGADIHPMFYLVHTHGLGESIITLFQSCDSN